MNHTPDQLPPEKFPDPWLFDTEALLTQLDRCREIIMNIPISDPQSTHLGINRAVNAIWDLQTHLRFLLHLHREGQRQFARAHQQQQPTPAPLQPSDNNIVHIAATHNKSSVSGHWRTPSTA
jgi:hypothetical protein